MAGKPNLAALLGSVRHSSDELSRAINENALKLLVEAVQAGQNPDQLRELCRQLSQKTTDILVAVYTLEKAVVTGDFERTPTG